MADAEERFWGGAKKGREKRERGAPADKNLRSLKRAAAKEVKKHGQKLAETLMVKALKGDVASARMVVTLAETKEGEAPKPKRRRRGLSLAQRLALEPSWDSLTPEQQKQSLIRSGNWDFAHDCQLGDWMGDELDEGLGTRDEGRGTRE
jgi:hypothetical protein